MASSTVTLYNSATESEIFTLDSVIGKETSYSGASSTPTFPVLLVLTKDIKDIGSMSNDRISASAKHAGQAEARAKVAISSTTLTVSVAKDPTSASALVDDAVESLLNVISYFTGEAPSETLVANAQAFVNGTLL